MPYELQKRLSISITYSELKYSIDEAIFWANFYKIGIHTKQKPEKNDNAFSTQTKSDNKS